MLNIHLHPSHKEKQSRQPGAVSPDVVHDASFQIMLPTPEVLDTENIENRVTSTYHSRSTQAASQKCSHGHL